MRLAASFILLGCLCTGPVSLLAQDAAAEEPELPSVRKGKLLLGAYFNFSVSTIEKTRVNGINTDTDAISAGMNVTVGKMLSDHWGLLMVAGYRKTSNSTPVTVGNYSATFEDSREDYVIAPSVRYYKLISEATYFFVQGNVYFSKGNMSDDEFDGTSKVNVKLNTQGYGVGISPGFSYFMTDKLSTEISIGLLGYTILTGDDAKGNKTVTRTFSSLLYLNSVSLGFVYYLGK